MGILDAGVGKKYAGLSFGGCTRSVPGPVALSTAALVLALLFISLCGTADAARVHPLEISETLPNGEAPVAVALNQATHHFYVASASGGAASHVYNFDEDARLDLLHPELTGAPLPKPFGVAVDNSGGANAGYIYVVNLGTFGESGSVEQFDPEGHATAVAITEAAIPANGTAQVGGLPPVVNKGSFEPRNVAVDDSGEIFVTDSSARAIDVFSPAGEFVRQIASALSVGFPNGIAIAGPDIYVAIGEQKDGALSPGLSEIDSALGECVTAGCPPINSAPIVGVAVDQAAGMVFTTGLQAGADGGEIREYEAGTNDLLGVSRPTALHRPGGIAVDETSHKLIVTDGRPVGEGTVKIFGEVKVVPDVTTLPPTAITDRSATLKGEIGAAAVPGGATCVFQYVDQEEFEANGFEGTPGHPAPTAQCEPSGPFVGEAMNPVQADLTGLRGGTTYHERILGTNSEGSNPGADIPFVTGGPTVAGTEASTVTEASATLVGTVNPNGSATTYRFQYLPQAQWEATGWAGATEAPAGGASIGGDVNPVPVSQAISGLVSGVTYRLRIFAVSGAGTTEGEEVEFTAQASPFPGLPDGRAYEQASPVQKNGANVQGAINSVQASLNGDGVTFFSNTGIPGGVGAQQFPTYLARRSAGAWTTAGLLPPAFYGPRAAVLGWTEDLEDTYDFAGKPSEGGALLRRLSSDGSVVEAGRIEAVLAASPFGYAGSSQGGAVALVESQEGGLLPEDREGRQNVYVYGRESNLLVVAGVMNDGTVPPGGAMAGPYDWFQAKSVGPNVLGGALRHYFTQAGHAISADGSEVFFTAGGTGQLYVRLNPLAPQSAMAGEECTEATKACTVRVSASVGVADPGTPAAFLGASADGRLVYFLDKGKLTADATAGPGYDLYRYDVTTGALIDLTLDTTDPSGARVEGMLGIGGPSGEDAYFVAAGQLAAGATQAPVGETNLYALHGTSTEFITRLAGPAGIENGDAVDWVPSSEFHAFGGPVSHAARVSADGQTLLFSSIKDLTSYRSHGKVELYLRRTGSPITCVSCNPSGEAPAGSAGVQRIPPVGFELPRYYAFMTRNLSADGQRVLFDSPDRLVSADRNTVNDVYEWEAPGKGSCSSDSQNGGCLSLISDGTAGAEPSWFGDADETGDNVFFFTSQQLVGQDRDELVDVYDARVGGGLPSQNPLPKVACEGETGCRAPVPPAPPAPPGPGSTSQLPRNPVSPPACKKGSVRKHGKCVKKAKKDNRNKKHKNGGGTGAKKSGKGKKGANR